jgi:hypothetical protein
MTNRIVVALAAVALLFGTAVAGKSSSSSSSRGSSSSSSSRGSSSSSSSSRGSSSSRASSSSSSRPKPATKTVTVSKSKYPQSAKHIEDAQKKGHPKTLTVDRGGASKNRQDSLKGTPRKSGKDRDEYPPAMFKEGGKGASVRHIDPKDNRGAGSSIGKQTRGVKDGDQVKIKVVK